MKETYKRPRHWLCK